MRRDALLVCPALIRGSAASARLSPDAAAAAEKAAGRRGATDPASAREGFVSQGEYTNTVHIKNTNMAKHVLLDCRVYESSK